AALFSAINTTFITITMPDLSPNPSDETNALLRLIVMKADNNTLTPADLSPPFSASPTSIAANCLLYASLSCSLLAAVGAMMSKEWLQSFDRTGQTGPLEDQGRFRQRKFNGVEEWHLEAVIRFLPYLLLLSVILFFAGTGLFLLPINGAVAAIVIAFSGLGTLLSVKAIVAGATFLLCPYQSAASSALRRLTVWFVGLRMIQSRRVAARVALAQFSRQGLRLLEDFVGLFMPYIAVPYVLVELFMPCIPVRSALVELFMPYIPARYALADMLTSITPELLRLDLYLSRRRKENAENSEEVIAAQAACWLLGTSSTRGDQTAASGFILTLDRDTCALFIKAPEQWQLLVSLARETFDNWNAQPNERSQEVAELFGLTLCHTSLQYSERLDGENDLGDLRHEQPKTFGGSVLQALGRAWTEHLIRTPEDEKYVFYFAFMSTIISRDPLIKGYQWGNLSRLLSTGKPHELRDVLLSLWVVVLSHIGTEDGDFPREDTWQRLLESADDKDWLAEILANVLGNSGEFICTNEGTLQQRLHLVEGYTACMRRARELSPLTFRPHLDQTASGVIQLINKYIDPLITSGPREAKPESIALSIEAVLGLYRFINENHQLHDLPELQDSQPARVLYGHLIHVVADMLLDDSRSRISGQSWMKRTRPSLVRILLWVWKNTPEISRQEEQQIKVFSSSCRLWTPLEKVVDAAKESSSFEEPNKPLGSEDLHGILEFIRYVKKTQNNSAFISRNADVGINRLYVHFGQRAEWEYEHFDLREQPKSCSRSKYLENSLL
ncbi:hypothetical protein FRC01_006324, partial [Tulasnella sp. 417]